MPRNLVSCFTGTLLALLLTAGSASAEASKQGAATANALAANSAPMATPVQGGSVARPAPKHHTTAKAKPKAKPTAKAGAAKPNAKPAVAHPHAAATAKPKKPAPGKAHPVNVAASPGPRQRV